MSGVRILSRTLYNIERAGCNTCSFYITNRPRTICPPGFVLHFVAVGAKRKSTGLPAPSHARSVRIAGSLYYQGVPAFLLSKNGCSTVFNGILSRLIDIIFELSESVFRYRSMSRSSSDIRI